jgi:hypothetical protein
VVAAVALLAAPYRETIAGWLSQAAQACYAERSALSRIAAALLILAAAWGQIPMPKLPAAPAVTVDVETPSVEMQQLVRPVADAMKSLPMGDRMLWAQTWNKAATVVAAAEELPARQHAEVAAAMCGGCRGTSERGTQEKHGGRA